MRVVARWIRVRRYLIAAFPGIPLFLLSAGAVFIYLRYSAVIDERLHAGLFQNSQNVYGAPLVLNEGDTLTEPELAALLHTARLNQSGNRPGTFQISGKTVDIRPFEGPPARVIFGDKQRISRIEVAGREARSVSLGYPLLANLSAGREKRRMVTFDEIPPVLVHAVVSAEDKRFFHHSGLDVPRIAKAAWVDFRDARKEQGASTLTMQLVRGLWLQPEKRWKRKLAEAVMTVHLERKLSKQKIFEAYANQVYLGRQTAYNIHGFAEGARAIFGKDLRELTLPEAALLAGMVQRPSYFNPFRYPERARQRRDLVLALMHENGYITAPAYRAAVNAPLNVAARQERDDSFGAQYFLDLLNDELPRADRSGQTAGDDNAKNVYTTSI